MWFTRLAISRPILIWMALAALALLGLQAYFRLPTELYPRVDLPTLTVVTVYPGAGPPEIETQISKPLEEAVGTVGGVTDVYSSSQPDVSFINVDFQVGTDLDVAVAEVRGRVEAVRDQLPAEARPPIVSKLDLNAQPVLYLGLESPSLTLQQLRALADNTLRPRLERVPGVGSVEIIGGEQREIRVAVDGLKLAQFGLTMADVVNSLKATGRDIPGGGITRGPRETDVRLAASFTSLDDIRNTQILAPQLAMRAGLPDARSPLPDPLPPPPLTIADVATVADGKAERTEINRINGQEGISLIFTKASDANTVAVVDAVRRMLDQMRPALPADLKLIVLRDDAQAVRAAQEDVNMSLFLGAALAMAVILLFLHNLRGTIIVSLAIPACILATFLVMWATHFTLNQMTLLALSLSVGILVDDSIVVLESITRHLRHGETPPEAALNGRTEIGFANLAVTLVDVVVFVPIAFMGGIVGGFFKQFGLTIASATLFSLVISFSVTPMLASRWYKFGEDLEAKRGVFAALERLYRRLEDRYRQALRFALRRRGLILLAAIAALTGIFVLSFTSLAFDFLPGTDQGQIVVKIETPPGTSLAATDAVARRAEAILTPMPDAQAVVTSVGKILGDFGYIPQQGAQFAQISVRLNTRAGLLERLSPFARSHHGRTISDQDFTQALRTQLEPIARETGSRVTATAVRSALGLSAPILLQLSGPDLNATAQVATQLRDQMARMPGILDPEVSVRSGKPEVRADIDPQRAAQFGVPAGQAGAILRDAIAGNTDAVYREGGQEFPIRAQLEGAQRNRPEDVENIVVGSDAQGQPVALADIATIALRAGPTNIDRQNGQRYVTVRANLAPNAHLADAQKRIDAAFHALPHDSIKTRWSGEAETMNETAIPFASALIMAVLLVYMVMASLFNNLGTPFVIMFTLPMALIGALGALVLTGESLSLVSGIGIIMLVGLMGRNAILLLDYTNTLRARGSERSLALEEAGATRLRPILMTTTATIVGMLPVALRFGQASETRAPMAIVVIGGLLVSTVLTLIVIPVLYSLFDDWLAHRAR